MNRLLFENEKEIRLKSLAGSVIIFALVMALLFLVRLIQTVPNPPPIEFVEVNFGTSDIGSGHIQTHNKPSPSPNPVDVKPSEEVPNKRETPRPQVEKTVVTPTPKVPDAKPARTAAEKPVITSKVESPVSEPIRPEPRRTETARPTAPVEKPAPPAPVKKAETVNNDALFKKSSGKGGSNGTIGKADGEGGNSNGDDASGVGDKGNPNGKVDAKSLYGTPGGSQTGVAFDVSGWSLAGRPNVTDNSDEVGKIVFQIRVDGDGNIVNIRTLQTTVSPSVVDVYRRAVQRLRLRPKGQATPPSATGTITFNITAK